jgi:5-bromo-4-chloroindolyl phosphate hydrolysis protein
MSSKEELVQFLDRHVFDPILKASPEAHKSNQEDLKYVQDRTRTEKERYHKYGSANEVVRMFKDDLNSENARQVNDRLKKLGLPRLVDVKDEFEQKAAA